MQHNQEKPNDVTRFSGSSTDALAGIRTRITGLEGPDHNH